MTVPMILPATPRRVNLSKRVVDLYFGFQFSQKLDLSLYRTFLGNWKNWDMLGYTQGQPNFSRDVLNLDC